MGDILVSVKTFASLLYHQILMMERGEGRRELGKKLT